MIDLFPDQKQQVETGVVAEILPDGYSRVTVSGQTYTARNQSGQDFPLGALVSVTATPWGRFIVAGAGRHAATVPTITIRG